jgi:hypothetical protein
MSWGYKSQSFPRLSISLGSQIMGAVKGFEADFGVYDIYIEMCSSAVTFFYKWRTKYGEMGVSLMSQMKILKMSTSG